MPKIPLIRRKKAAWQGPGCGQTALVASWPFYRSHAAGKRLVHRVRSGDVYWRDGKLSHIAVTLCCGNHGYPTSKGDLLEHAPDGVARCAACEKHHLKHPSIPAV